MGVSHQIPDALSRGLTIRVFPCSTHTHTHARTPALPIVAVGGRCRDRKINFGPAPEDPPSAAASHSLTGTGTRLSPSTPQFLVRSAS